MLAMSKSRGICSSFNFVPLISCQLSLKFFRSEISPHTSFHPISHTNSLSPTTDFHGGSHGCLVKVKITCLVVYGCSRVGVSPPIHHCIFSFLLAFVPFWWLHFLPGSLGSGRDEKISLRCWFSLRIKVHFGYDWSCFQGFYWHRCHGFYSLNLAILATSWSIIVRLLVMQYCLGGGSNGIKLGYVFFIL
ncbi:hypothetical protein RchiOBHm_Chr6g0293021 [Rosa chinensis]|uniref:Transmembrane protein n=1 Tax=Rosa chinensis TaxID=74649 RepID=A0A2P6PWI2_ROSCH|nr:hypothetical protein RchiOBHm_Chr6g0293021 [Rosa chinensis]